MLKECKTFVYECDRCGANSDNQNGFDAVLPSGWTQGGSMVCCPGCPPAQAPDRGLNSSILSAKASDNPHSAVQGLPHGFTQVIPPA